MLVQVWAPSPRPSLVPPREQTGALAQPRLFAWGLVLKAAFLLQNQLFPVVMCVIKSPEHCLFIAEIKTKLFLSFMALCVCVCIY